MHLDIVKCHGSGNDFVMIDARAIDAPGDGAWARIARALSDRSGPVGSDGLLLLTRAAREDADFGAGDFGAGDFGAGDFGAGDFGAADFGMVMLNPDGSEAELCLNGLRCVARLGFETFDGQGDGQGGGDGADLEADREAATVSLPVRALRVTRARPIGPGVYTVGETAGPASLAYREWPMRPGTDDARDEHVERVIPAWPSARAFTAVAMPNPHLIAFVDTVDEDELVAVGRIAESAPGWLPNRANVSFVEVRGEGAAAALYVRTFERGAGLTQSCGSAMAAATHAAALTGRIEWAREIDVLNKGGLVRASAARDGSVTIAGNATYDWAGSIEVDPATGAADAPVIARRFPEEAAAWAALTGGG